MTNTTAHLSGSTSTSWMLNYVTQSVFAEHGASPCTMSNLNPHVNYGFALVPDADQYILANCSVPTVLLSHPRIHDLVTDSDSLARCDIVISDGTITDICVPGKVDLHVPVVDLEGGCVFPTFVDLHTHIGAFTLMLKVESAPRRP